MRTVTPEATACMQQQFGSEPLFILGVQWIEDGPEILYADQEIGEGVRPQIIEISDFDTTIKISGASDSQSISITLDDVDGTLKDIFDSTDIHHKTCNVYQHFSGLSIQNKFLLFKGKIVSPIEWDEGARTLRFDIMTQLDATEVAFSMEEGHFPHIPEDALGKVWPLVFGQVCNMMAQQVRSPRRGLLNNGEGIIDFTLPSRICQAQYIQCPSGVAGNVNTLTPDGLGGFTITQDQNYAPDKTCIEQRFNKICELKDLYEQQIAYEHSVLSIRGGENFPQDEPVVINVGGAKFWGSFEGTIFHVTNREHPDYQEIWSQMQAHPCKEIEDHTFGYPRWHFTGTGTQWELNPSGTTWSPQPETFQYEDCDSLGGTSQVGEGGASESQKYFDEMPKSDFHWISPGTEVFLEDEAEVLYIVSLIPGTIDNVAAYKTQPSGRSLLTTVPATYYNVYETDYDGYDVVEIGFVKPLSQYDDTWHDDIYVSFTSDVGPNPVDIIIWLLNKYTSLTYDTTTFNAVKTKLTNYPCNFWVKERLNVWQLIQDIAYQSRCAVFVRADKVYIVYLSEEPASLRILTVDDIIAKTFKIRLTDTEEIATKHVITWKASEGGVEDTDPIDRKIVLKHNIPKHGLQQKDINYYTQNTYDTILKSATFWMIRDSNMWKILEFETPLMHLDLDIFDCITLDIPIFGSAIKVVITGIQYQNSSNSMKFECLTPLRAGESTSYPFFWAASAPQLLMFPLEEEEPYAGAGYDFEVSPPTGHILAGGDVTDIADRIVIMTSGDTFPSDIGDIIPTIECLVSGFQEIEEPDPVFEAFQRAANSQYQGLENQTNSGAGGNGGSDQDNKKRRKVCGEPEYGYGCVYEVRVIYVTPGLIRHCPCLPSEVCFCHTGAGGEKGSVCTGPLTVFCHSFGSLFAASLFASQIQAQIAAMACNYQTGVTAPYMMNGRATVDDPTDSEDCEFMLPGDQSADHAGDGETFSPHQV